MDRIIVEALLIFLVTASAYTDITHGKVYNALTMPAIATGLASNGLFRGIDGLADSFSAASLAFAFLIVPFALRGIGAGDLKLLRAVGALGGITVLAPALFWSAVIAGAIAGFMLAYRRVAPAGIPLNGGWEKANMRTLSFAAVIAIGCLLALYVR